MHPTQREVPAPAIKGNVIDLGEGGIAAIYKRDGTCWVAQFQYGRGTLVDVSAWFRSHGGALRYSGGRRANVLETMVPIPPELSARIELLHRQRNAGDARVPQISTMVLSAFERWCVEMNRKRRGDIPGWAALRLTLRVLTTTRKR